MYIGTFVNITSRAWAIPILASLYEGVAGRQAPLLSATGANRTAFSQSVDHLMELGLLERNPGYGHPLRPEFRLTSMGKAAAKLAHQIHSTIEEQDQDLIRRSWTLPVLSVLHERRHFNEIKSSLPAITDRALSQSLKSMEARDWVHRSVSQETRPPRSSYSAINTGQKINLIAQSILKLA